jgi:hypothetical protein
MTPQEEEEEQQQSKTDILNRLGPGRKVIFLKDLVFPPTMQATNIILIRVKISICAKNQLNQETR